MSALRFNLSVALVAMVNATALDTSIQDKENSSISSDCPKPLQFNSSHIESQPEGEFTWDEVQQGYVLSSFFYGYIIMQIPGGIIVTRFGGKHTMGISILIIAILSLLTPLAARWHIGALITVRALEGLAAGFNYPALFALTGKWIPPLELSKLLALLYAGFPIGSIISMAVTGYLCKSSWFGGWPSSFYVLGVFAIIWFVFWTVFIHESPDVHPRITEEERKYICESIVVNTKTLRPFPIKSALTSLPYLSCAFCLLCFDLGSYNVLITAPTYLATILYFDISQNGLLSALPPICYFVFSLIFSQFIDYLRANGRLSTTAARKLANTVGYGSIAFSLFCVYFAGCNKFLVVTLFCLSYGLEGAVSSGCLANMVDLAPQYAGLTMGIFNTFSSISGVSPYISGVLIKSYGKTGWLYFFSITAGLCAFSVLFCLIFGSGELQPWAKDPQIKEPTETTDFNDSVTTEQVIFSTKL